MEPTSKIPSAFPPIAGHGVVGDRRSGALIAADGTLNWFCTPNFDSPPVFGALLDSAQGGHCRWAPDGAGLGRQEYLQDTAVLLTTWGDSPGVELADVMAGPGDNPPTATPRQRIIIRRVRASSAVKMRFDLRPRRDFSESPTVSQEGAEETTFAFGDGTLLLWASFPVRVTAEAACAEFFLETGDEHWAVLAWNESSTEWSIARASASFSEAESYWRKWSAGLKCDGVGERASALRRSAITIQLLSHAEQNSAVAALTSSLPERIGGDRNYDYRYAWIRDGSLALALLARLGKAEEVRHYLDWLCQLGSTVAAPLQVCYRLDGGTHMAQEKVADISGYENSLPVHRGNRAYQQEQPGAMGFFSDCARIFLEHGGEWRPEFWQLLTRAADFTVQHWQEKDNGIWELPEKAHYVASRVMAWVLLDRAVKIGQMTGQPDAVSDWQRTASVIHAEVMDKGWSEEKNAFRQKYDSKALDSAALLIPLMEFLPIDHPRVRGTIAALERELVVKGLLHRFDPRQTLGAEELPMGEFEGAFLPCVFWHAHVLAKAGRRDEAEAILRRCEAAAGGAGLFAEELDAERDTFLGNTPLLFSHVEYARAVLELNRPGTTSA
jgi:GH15 family glucan-1,4-alpha-glucosidase